MADDLLVRFAASLQEDLKLGSETEGPDASLVDALTSRMISELTEAGEIDDGYVCYFQARGVQINGYSTPEDDGSPSLFVTIHVGQVPPQTVGRTEAETAFRRLAGFITLARVGQHPSIQPHSAEHAMLQEVREVLDTSQSARLFLLTDGLTTLESKPDELIGGLRVSYHVWDIRRLYRCVTSGQHREPIRVDFCEFGGPLQCLEAPTSGSEYQTYLAAIPGNTLAALYERFGPRLLELNVRSFLQARGKVNQGIRSTILTEPERFLAYNNGISVTTSKIDMGKRADGVGVLVSADDLQIVNGGQTTASLYHALKKDRADLSSILVPVKVSVVSPSLVRDVVPLISKYANSQNKINNADFHANDPFHVRLEELSRTVWAPPAPSAQRQTKWFYERARGQYQDEMGRSRTSEFKRVFPPGQRFTKTELAVFEHCWDQLPHVVSAGAEKNFREFTIRLSNRQRRDPDQGYYERLIGKAILYRNIRSLVTSLQLGGYRANIVAYTVAFLAHRTAQRLDLDRVWRQQSIGDPLAEAAGRVAVAVHRSITDPPGGANVTEWCKREACWVRIRNMDVDLSGLEDGLIPLAHDGEASVDRGLDTPDETELQEIAAVKSVPAQYWFALANWARVTGNLAPWQRSLAFSIGRLIAQHRSPSRRQAHQGNSIMSEARRLGFLPDSAAADSVASTSA